MHLYQARSNSMRNAPKAKKVLGSVNIPGCLATQIMEEQMSEKDHSMRQEKPKKSARVLRLNKLEGGWKEKEQKPSTMISHTQIHSAFSVGQKRERMLLFYLHFFSLPVESYAGETRHMVIKV